MSDGLNYILEQIRNEIKTYNQLGAMLEQSAHDISMAAAPPSEDLLAAMAAARAKFSSLKKDLVRLNGVNADSLTSLKAMEQLVDQCLAEERQGANHVRQHEGLALLDKIMQLQSTIPSHQQALEDCQNQARHLQEQLRGFDSTIMGMEELEQIIAPFQALVTLVELSDQLEDGYWLELNSMVERSFGTPLALAASRRKLLMESRTASQAEREKISPLAIAEDDTPASDSALSQEEDHAPNPSARKKWPIALAAAVILAAFAVYAYQTQFTFRLDGYRLRTFGVNMKSINTPLSNGDTYLAKAIKEKNLAAMQLLLKHGARINDRDGAGNTPLHEAVYANFKDGAALLVDNGADLALKDAQGKSPGDLALSLGNPDIASLLLAGATPPQPRDTSSARNPFAMGH
ncbi:MAG TPA: ankyrin repeat domain-containing protein [Syntrophomonadaceae bacterium]|nr:ankyrin repeat domain-containing protein [Syntrophomonadaceae bacterium]